MTPHTWVKTDQGDEPAEARKPTFWVRCTRCGALVVTDESLFAAGKVHYGWRMLEDCVDQMAADVMEE